MAPILRALSDQKIEYNYISTGQHKDTMDAILSCFKIKTPDYILYRGKDITSIIKMFIWAISIIFTTIKDRKKIFKNDRNGIVLVHGDTFSTLLGAIIGKIGSLKVAHIESGLRSYNLFHPFPEEITRLITFKLSDYLFCPGDLAINNLKNYSAIKINTHHNTLVDALELALPEIKKSIKIDLPHEPYVIVTLHRFENIKNNTAITRLIKLVDIIAKEHKILFILHKPTEIKLKKFGYYQQLKKNKNIEFRQRYDYFKFIKLIIHAKFIVSDGGSNQEECYYLGKPIILLRQATERKEGLGENCILSKYDCKIVKYFSQNFSKYKRQPQSLLLSPSLLIVKAIEKFNKS
ncbi:MAG: UDP-N-acetylglucosamine 2-epimerase [Pseudomonadota bacterium]